MKNYQTPELEAVAFDTSDVIATSEPAMENVVELVYDQF